MITIICKVCGKEKTLFEYPRFGKDGRFDLKFYYDIICRDCIKSGNYHSERVRRCTGCRRIKPFSEFYNEKRQDRWCKKCSKEYREFNRDRIKKRYRENREREIKRSTEWSKNKYKEDPIYRLVSCQRTRLCSIFKGANISKSKKTLKYIGCTKEELKQHIEDQFSEGMTWDRYLNGEIHIDHMLPLRLFDLTKESERCKAFHYTNLQPLWAEWNLWKADKYIEMPDGEKRPITLKLIIESLDTQRKTGL